MRIVITVLFCLLLTVNSFAVVSITGVTGMVDDQESVVIAGSGFGATGPTIVVFDNFEDVGAVNGADVDLTATVGSWDGTGTYEPRYANVGRSGNWSAELSIAVAGEYVLSQFNVDFTAATEYFLSYAVQVPDGTYVPHSVNPDLPANTWPDESVWKFAWIRDYENDPDASPGDDDKCLPTFIGDLVTDGNDLNYSNGASSIEILDTATDTWWQWGPAWNRVSFWGKADAANPSTSNGYEWAQGIGEGVEQLVRTLNNRPLFAGGTAPYQFTRLHINGWIRPTTDTKQVKLLYDDIYLAVGAGAAARVEIGNANTYTTCTKLVIAIPTAWATDEITATVNQGSLPDGTAYLYVVDADGAVNANGYQITLGEAVQAQKSFSGGSISGGSLR